MSDYQVYSKKTKKLYDTVAELEQAEKEFDAANLEKEKMVEQRKKDAKEVSDAYNAILVAQKEYYAKRDAFIKKYGSYHMTYTNTGEQTVFDLIRGLLDW